MVVVMERNSGGVCGYGGGGGGGSGGGGGGGGGVGGGGGGGGRRGGRRGARGVCGVGIRGVDDGVGGNQLWWCFMPQRVNSNKIYISFKYISHASYYAIFNVLKFKVLMKMYSVPSGKKYIHCKYTFTMYM